MLAKNYRDFQNKISYPLHVQPKLNGIRALCHRGRFQSRDEHFWQPGILDHLTTDVDFPADMLFDGELYVHGWSLQQINSAISVNRVDITERTAQVEYHIFDCISLNDVNLPFAERSKLLTWWFNTVTNRKLKQVPTHRVVTANEGNSWYSHYKAAGYEGLMYRLNEPYGVLERCGNKENRWNVLLKRKEFVDWEGKVVGIKESDINPGTVGALVFEFDNGNEFSAGSGLSHEQKLRYFHAPPIGRLVRIEYLMLSDKGTPLNPYVDCVFE